ncbi:MAG TPA: hypothetical protein VGU71_03380 [Candidatus Dormibacteraeota bacterium]|nr:hypothetical protein [Candidatus Dormibacteraeota bacterium]
MARTEDAVGSEIQQIEVDRLTFDPLNPRLPRTVDGHSKSAVLKWMLEDASLLELMNSIGIQGYFPGEPLVVVPGPQSRLIVVEGNRRLAAVLLLAHPSTAGTRRTAVQTIAAEAAFRPDVLPCVVFASRDEVIDYLGYRHVTGIKEWEPLAKARYVEQLLGAGHAKGKDPLAIVARKIGSKRSYLARLMGALTLYDYATAREIVGSNGLDESEINFSFITLALGYPSIRGFAGLSDDSSSVHGAKENVRSLFDWMFKQMTGGTTVLGESRNMGDLAAVIDKPAALKALRSGRSLADALLLTEAPLQVFRTSIREAKERLQTATLQLSVVHEITDLDIASVEEIVVVSRDLRTLLQSRREDSAAASS